MLEESEGGGDWLYCRFLCSVFFLRFFFGFWFLCFFVFYVVLFFLIFVGIVVFSCWYFPSRAAVKRTRNDTRDIESIMNELSEGFTQGQNRLVPFFIYGYHREKFVTRV